MKKTAILLHDIRSIHNVGSIFRTADAFGVEKIYLSGYSPLPVDRFGRKRADLAKVALGAEESVAWEQAHSPAELVAKLKQEGFEIVVLEQAENSIDYTKVRDLVKDKNVLVIFGNEVGGVPQELLVLANVIAEIPMRGEKESLNVSVAGGILLSRLLD